MITLEGKKVFERLPEPLAGLEKLALNLWWSWTTEVRDLFAEIDGKLWDECGHNPVGLLSGVDDGRLAKLASDDEFLAMLESRGEALERYLARGSKKANTAYLSMEYALHPSLPLYSGGLGVLSGDHLKAASDLHLPLMAVGLFYRKGYFVQRLDSKGVQYERLPQLDTDALPVQRVCDGDGKGLRVAVDLSGRRVEARVWLLQVGTVALYLLDTDVEENQTDDRRISWQLYIGDRRMRMEQEMVLGMGAVGLLEDGLELAPQVYHLNEGHCALSLLDRIRREVEKGADLDKACNSVREHTVFTTHTPVAAGNEEFSTALVDEYLGATASRFGMSADRLHCLGRVDGDGDGDFSLTVLALKLSRYANAVSRLHGEVCREMWNGVWPDREMSDVPIAAITNGVHLSTWLGRPLGRVIREYTGGGGDVEIGERESLGAVEQMPSDVLWGAHNEQKEQLMAVARERIRVEGLRRGEDGVLLDELAAALDPGRLTVGFARRFATYKRATLMLEDPQALDALLNDEQRPVQLILAGKAHPADTEGKALIRRVFEASREERFRGRIVFLENYDMELGRLLTGGVDLWLNNPIRPLEACGTSGMKATINGVLNLSIRDGWWDEVDRVGYGFSIDGASEGDQDDVDRTALYDMLRDSVAPLFYDRDEAGLPEGWIRLMRRSICDLGPRYTARRMVSDYADTAYYPRPDLRF